MSAEAVGLLWQESRRTQGQSYIFVSSKSFSRLDHRIPNATFYQWFIILFHFVACLGSK